MAIDRLRLAGVTKRYSGRAALDSVSFTIPRGQTVGYLGPNGAGKTTTLRIACGLTAPDEGSIEIDGRDPRADGGRALSQVGVLIETPGILPYVHGSDFLEYIASVRGISRADRPGAIRRAAERLEVTDQLARPMGGLSTGLTRRVLLAGAILGDPPLLLLDEPTLGLDPAARASLRRVLRDLRADGRSILLSTHLLDDVEAVCDRVLFLRDGRLVGDEPVRPEGTDRPPTARRSLRIRLLHPVSTSDWAGDRPGAEEWTVDGPREATVRFDGGDEEQAAILSDIVQRLGPLVRASESESDLARRYSEIIGRGDDA